MRHPFHTQAMANIRRRHVVAMGQLHPTLRVRVEQVLVATGGRLAAWEGYRDEAGQEAARKSGASNARWLQSPHNYKPALACDLVLVPAFVAVRGNPRDPRWPDLWDDESPDAVEAWRDLETACQLVGLDRVMLGPGRPDLPHVQLPGWRAMAGL